MATSLTTSRSTAVSASATNSAPSRVIATPFTVHGTVPAKGVPTTAWRARVPLLVRNARFDDRHARRSELGEAGQGNIAAGIIGIKGNKAKAIKVGLA